jgi:hypothetical protein
MNRCRSAFLQHMTARDSAALRPLLLTPRRKMVVGFVTAGLEAAGCRCGCGIGSKGKGAWAEAGGGGGGGWLFGMCGSCCGLSALLRDGRGWEGWGGAGEDALGTGAAAGVEVVVFSWGLLGGPQVCLLGGGVRTTIPWRHVALGVRRSAEETRVAAGNNFSQVLYLVTL